MRACAGSRVNGEIATSILRRTTHEQDQTRFPPFSPLSSRPRHCHGASAFADDMKKDTMSKDSMKKDDMKKDTMKKDDMAKDSMKKDTMKKDDMKK